jgi:hypothetical protein
MIGLSVVFDEFVELGVGFRIAILSYGIHMLFLKFYRH